MRMYRDIQMQMSLASHSNEADLALSHMVQQKQLMADLLKIDYAQLCRSPPFTGDDRIS
jgi:hypothetical protein